MTKLLVSSALLCTLMSFATLYLIKARETVTAVTLTPIRIWAATAQEYME